MKNNMGTDMETQNMKCVMVIDENLPLGLITNTAAVMGVTIGKQIPQTVGIDVYDKTGNRHLGVTKFPIPILKGNPSLIKELREKLYLSEYCGLMVIDFSDVAQGCKTYDEFTGKIAGVAESELNYLGIAICGDRKQVNKLTGSIPLLR